VLRELLNHALVILWADPVPGGEDVIADVQDDLSPKLEPALGSPHEKAILPQGHRIEPGELLET
jgi:hypothetical protein